MVWVVPIARATFDRCGVVWVGEPQSAAFGGYSCLSNCFNRVKIDSAVKGKFKRNTLETFICRPQGH